MLQINPLNYDQLKSVLEQLFADAGYERPELLQLLRQAELQQAELGRLQEQEGENERLKQEVKRLRELYYSKTMSAMSTKLKDALRE
jgi:uncharacterized membrane protein YccC